MASKGRAYLVKQLQKIQLQKEQLQKRVSRRQAVKIVNLVFREMGEALKRGEDVEFPTGKLRRVRTPLVNEYWVKDRRGYTVEFRSDDERYPLTEEDLQDASKQPGESPASAKKESTAGKLAKTIAGYAKKDLKHYETIESPRARADEIIVNLIRAELGENEQPPKPEKVAEVLSVALKHMQGRYREWSRERNPLWQLPMATTEKMLLVGIRPSGTPAMSKTEQVGLWVADTLNFICKHNWEGIRAIQEAKRQLVEGEEPPSRAERQYVRKEAAIPKKYHASAFRWALDI